MLPNWRIGILFLGVGVSYATETSPRKDFTGVDDQGSHVACKYEGTFEPFGQSHYQCQFGKGTTTIVAYGKQSLQKTWCAVHSGVVPMFDCLAGIGDFAEFYVKSSASTTGLLACRLPSIFIKPIQTQICSNAHNPAAGLFGYPGAVKNFARCQDSKGRHLRLDTVTESKEAYSAGDLGVIVYNPDTRVTITSGRLKRTDKDSFAHLETEFKVGPSSVSVYLPLRALVAGEQFVARALIGEGKIHDRISCVRGEVP